MNGNPMHLRTDSFSQHKTVSLMFRRTCKAKAQREAKNNPNNEASGLKN